MVVVAGGNLSPRSSFCVHAGDFLRRIWLVLTLGDMSMAQKISGGCACGAIHYECNADPVVMLNCHCRDCQRASGSAYAAVVAVPKSAVQMRGGGKRGRGHVTLFLPRGKKPRQGKIEKATGCPGIAGGKPE